MIDIIIPAYNAHKTLPNALSSIAIQTLAKFLKVIIVNDGGPGYDDEIELFKRDLDIEVITIENSGPAIARQVGFEKSSNKYVMFMDADDVLLSAFSVALLLPKIDANDDIVCVNSRFISEYEPNEYRATNHKEFIWLFGNIYRRNFIEKNNIRFPIFSANEDLIFNLEIQIKAMQQKKEVLFTDDHTYIWKFNPNSITRRDDREYSFFESSYYVIKGKLDLFKKFNEEDIFDYVISSIWDFYYFWEESVYERKDRMDYHNDLMEISKEFYSTYRHILDQVTDDQWRDINAKKKKLINYLSRMNFMDYIAIMKKSTIKDS